MSDFHTQLESYGDQLEEAMPRYEFTPSGSSSGRSNRAIPWGVVLGAAASLTLLVGIFIWAQGRDDDSRSLEVIDQPVEPSEVEISEALPTDLTGLEPTVESEADSAAVAVPTVEPLATDECEGLNVELLSLPYLRPTMRVAVAEIESSVGVLPAELEAGPYSTTALGIELTFDAGECITLIEENPGMLTFVPAGEPLSAVAPWMSVFVPSVVSSTGSVTFSDVRPVGVNLGAWAATVDGVDATSLGPVQVAGVNGIEWELGVNTASPETFFCPQGQCASVVRPQVGWWGSYSRGTLFHSPGFIHVDSTNTTRVIELDVAGTRLWIWRQAPPTDDGFFDRSDTWLDGWSFGTAVAQPDHNGYFGPVDVGPLTVASGANVTVFEEGWSVLSNSPFQATLAPLRSASLEAPDHVIQMLRLTDDEFEPITVQQTIEQIADLEAMVGWSITAPAPGRVGDFDSTVVEITSFGSGSVGNVLFTQLVGRAHIVEAGDSAWMVLLAAPDVEAVNELERAATQLLTGAELPDWSIISD